MAQAESNTMEIADFSARKIFGAKVINTGSKFVFLLGYKGDYHLDGNTWKKEICYGYITRYCEYPIDRLYLFVPPKVRRHTTILNTRDYLNWFINSEMFGEAFITKDVDQGFEIGFEVDCSADRALVYGAIQAFRLGFENESFGWSYYRSLGYDPYLSWAMASCFSLWESSSEGKAHVRAGRAGPTPSDHTLLDAKMVELRAFYPGHRRPCPREIKPLCECGSWDEDEDDYYLKGWSKSYWYHDAVRKLCIDYSKVFGVDVLKSVKMGEENAKKLESALRRS